MDSVLPLLSRDSAILAALSRTDSAVWCFLPLSDDFPAGCSAEFIVQWGPLLSDNGDVAIQNISAAMIRQALWRFGVDPMTFPEIEPHPLGDLQSPILITRNDGVKLEALIALITAPDGKRIGHLLRFRRPAENIMTDAILREVAQAQQRLAELSPREQEILSLVYQGQTNKAISRGTGISEKTVEKHRSRIMQKLRLTCHAALYRLVSRALLFTDRDPSGATDDAAIDEPESRNIQTPHMFRFSDRIHRQ